jgi:tetratricopeptide (TPR) repeat protein
MKYTRTILLLILCFLIKASLINAQHSVWDNHMKAGIKAYEIGRYPEAEREFRAALSQAEKLNKGKEDKVSSDRLLLSLNFLGGALQQLGKYAEAEQITRRAVTLIEAVREENDPEIAVMLNNLGLFLGEQGKYEEAEDVHRRVLQWRERFLGAKHSDVAVSLINLGRVQYEQEEWVNAKQSFDRAFVILTDIPEEQRTDEQYEYLVMCANNLALIYVEEKKYDQAEQFYLKAMEILTALKGPQHPDLVGYLKNYAKLLRTMNRVAEADKVDARIEEIKGQD